MKNISTSIQTAGHPFGNKKYGSCAENNKKGNRKKLPHIYSLFIVKSEKASEARVNMEWATIETYGHRAHFLTNTMKSARDLNRPVRFFFAI